MFKFRFDFEEKEKAEKMAKFLRKKYDVVEVELIGNMVTGEKHWELWIEEEKEEDPYENWEAEWI